MAWRCLRMERAMGIEPTAQAWEAWVLPLYDARAAYNVYRRRPYLKITSLGCRERFSV
jgi:hypothetical protein